MISKYYLIIYLSLLENEIWPFSQLRRIICKSPVLSLPGDISVPSH